MLCFCRCTQRNKTEYKKKLLHAIEFKHKDYKNGKEVGSRINLTRFLPRLYS
jgi:hypothetical protein